jgi:hypothetical protein
VRAFDRLHVEVDSACGGVFADRGIAGVCEGARLSVAETGDVVFVPAEVLLFCGPGTVRFEIVGGIAERT